MSNDTLTPEVEATLDRLALYDHHEQACESIAALLWEYLNNPTVKKHDTKLTEPDKTSMKRAAEFLSTMSWMPNVFYKQWATHDYAETCWNIGEFLGDEFEPATFEARDLMGWLVWDYVTQCDMISRWDTECEDYDPEETKAVLFEQRALSPQAKTCLAVANIFLDYTQPLTDQPMTPAEKTLQEVGSWLYDVVHNEPELYDTIFDRSGVTLVHKLADYILDDYLAKGAPGRELIESLVRQFLACGASIDRPTPNPADPVKSDADAVRIESDPHYTITRAGTVTNTKTGRVLKPFPRGKASGLSVSLPSGTHYVHTLVAAAFLGPRPEGHDIIHLDGDQVNLHADNLAYVTRSERMKGVYYRARRQLKGANIMTSTPNPGIERNVVPEFWSTPGINKTCPEARLLYLAMHTWADDHGRGLRDPDALKWHAFPRDPIVTRERVSELLHQIQAVFSVTYYTVNGRDYYQIDDWADTQYEPDMEPVHPSPEHPNATHIH